MIQERVRAGLPRATGGMECAPDRAVRVGALNEGVPWDTPPRGFGGHLHNGGANLPERWPGQPAGSIHPSCCAAVLA
jgi:hypothetical protein